MLHLVYHVILLLKNPSLLIKLDYFSSIKTGTLILKASIQKSILPDYFVTMIQESSIVEGIVHMMAENDHNSYFQIVCSEVMPLKILISK